VVRSALAGGVDRPAEVGSGNRRVEVGGVDVSVEVGGVDRRVGVGGADRRVGVRGADRRVGVRGVDSRASSSRGSATLPSGGPPSAGSGSCASPCLLAGEGAVLAGSGFRPWPRSRSRSCSRSGFRARGPAPGRRTGADGSPGPGGGAGVGSGGGGPGAGGARVGGCSRRVARSATRKGRGTTTRAGSGGRAGERSPGLRTTTTRPEWWRRIQVWRASRWRAVTSRTTVVVGPAGQAVGRRDGSRRATRTRPRATASRLAPRNGSLEMSRTGSATGPLPRTARPSWFVSCQQEPAKTTNPYRRHGSGAPATAPPDPGVMLGR
jgi:hypothetical protein